MMMKLKFVMIKLLQMWFLKKKADVCQTYVLRETKIMKYRLVCGTISEEEVPDQTVLLLYQFLLLLQRLPASRLSH